MRCAKFVAGIKRGSPELSLNFTLAVKANRPLVTVMMPVCSAGRFLAPALDSLLAQSFGDWELLAVDDGSSDGSLEELQRYAARDARIRPFSQARNLGIPQTRNFTLDRARGDYLAFLNHDDVATPDRLLRQMEFLEAHHAIDLLGSDFERIDADSVPQELVPMPQSDLEIRWRGLLDCPMRQSSLMLRGEFIARTGLRYDPAFAIHSDYDFIMRALQLGTAANLPEVLLCYRQHTANTSRIHLCEIVENGARIALSAIHHELPAYAITLEDVRAIRSAVLGFRTEGVQNTLATIKSAVRMYLDLFEAFAAKHRGNPLLEAFRHQVTGQPAETR